MEASARSPYRFWLIVFAAIAAVLWLFQPVLAPFLAGLAIAYFLEPVVSLLERRRVPRWVGTPVVLFGFVAFLVALGLLVWPLLNHQISVLVETLPGYVAKLRDRALPVAQDWMASVSPEDVTKLRDAASKSTGQAVAWLSQAVSNIISSGVALIDMVALSVLMLVTSFYALLDWHRFIAVIDSLIPRRYYAVTREQLAAIDATLSGFLRGQALVCAALGFVYSIGLSLIGLEYGATVGIVSGVLSIIPYVGTVFGWSMSLLLASIQPGFDGMHIAGVLGVFALGHVLESYVLTPRFVGNRVGLHPVWILFALIAGGKLMGFTGVLIAVPVAAVLGVLVRFGVQKYKESGLYK